MPSTWLMRLPRLRPKTTMKSSEETTGASVVWVQRRRTRWHSRRASQRKPCQGLGTAWSFTSPKASGGCPPSRGRLAVGDHVHHRAAGLAQHKAAHAPFLVPKRIGDFEALLQGAGVDGVDVVDPDRDPRRRG